MEQFPMIDRKVPNILPINKFAVALVAHIEPLSAHPASQTRTHLLDVLHNLFNGLRPVMDASNVREHEKIVPLLLSIACASDRVLPNSRYRAG